MEWQDVTALASGFIALCALVFSFWQAAESRKHNRLSFKPHLTTWAERHPDKGNFGIELINSGLGPAIVKRFDYLLDGEPLGENSIARLRAELEKMFPGRPFEAGIGSFENGYAMPANARVTVLRVQFRNEPFPTATVVEQLLNRGDIEVTYQSFYGEEFHLSTKTEPTIKPLRMIAMEQGPF